MDNFDMTPGIAEGYKNKLKSQLFKLLPLREKGEPWWKYLDTILVELYGLRKTHDSIYLTALIANLQELRFLNFKYHRKVIFENIKLIDKLDL